MVSTTLSQPLSTTVAKHCDEQPLWSTIVRRGASEKLGDMCPYRSSHETLGGIRSGLTLSDGPPHLTDYPILVTSSGLYEYDQCMCLADASVHWVALTYNAHLSIIIGEIQRI